MYLMLLKKIATTREQRGSSARGDQSHRVPPAPAAAGPGRAAGVVGRAVPAGPGRHTVRAVRGRRARARPQGGGAARALR